MALSQEAAEGKGITSQMYSQIQSMIDSLNNMSDSIMVKMGNMRDLQGQPSLINMNILVYNYLANNEIITTPEVDLPAQHTYNPEVVAVSCIFTTLSGESTTHELYVYSAGGGCDYWYYIYGNNSFYDVIDGVSWPVRLGYKIPYVGDSGYCIWYIYGWLDDYWYTHPWD